MNEVTNVPQAPEVIIEKKDGVSIVRKDKIEDLHISPSQINSFKRCMAVWYFRYVKGYKSPPSIASTLGNCFDDALTTNYEQKIQSKEDMRVDEVIDAFNKSFEIRKDEADFSQGDKEEIRNTGQGLVKTYQNDIAPTIQPTATQRRYDLQFGGVDWKYVCITDVEMDGLVIDNKTISRSPSLDKATDGFIIQPDHLFQLHSYAIAKVKTDGINPKLRIDYAVKTKIPKIVQAVVRDLTESDVEYFNKITAAVYRQMELLKDGAMPPVPDRSNMLCSRKYCGFWERCEALFGGRVRE